VEPMFARETEQESERIGIVRSGPAQAAGCEAGITRDVVVVGDEPHRNSAPTEAADHAEAAVVAAEDQRAHGLGLPGAGRERRTDDASKAGRARFEWGPFREGGISRVPEHV